jgi:Uma2 family endonuclease
MDEWMENGCLLAWLIDIDSKTIYIYRKNREREVLKGLSHILSGEDVLPEFTLDLKEIE